MASTDAPRLAVAPDGPGRFVAAHLGGDRLTLLDGPGDPPGGVVTAPAGAASPSPAEALTRAESGTPLAGSSAGDRFLAALGGVLGVRPTGVGISAEECDGPGPDGVSVLEALAALGYLPTSAEQRRAHAAMAGMPGDALRAIQRFVAELDNRVAVADQPVTAWTGRIGALLGPTISQSLGQEWCVVTAYAGWEAVVGAVLPDGATLPVTADAVVDGPADGGVPVPRIAWLDTGYIRTPVVPFAELAEGDSLEGPRRVVTSWSACVVPPETIATRVGAALVCGPEKWSGR